VAREPAPCAADRSEHAAVHTTENERRKQLFAGQEAEGNDSLGAMWPNKTKLTGAPPPTLEK